ncbi:glycosyltransferase [Paenibacillus thailandensis]|uniref:Glycosyltransferase n=1 Tax=Paenibacillus thailandensis TaxID=393250 RepID=A0ABW5QS88_9BACL
MNIWLMTTEYPPFYGGGIGTYCHNTAKLLNAHGHQVRVIVPDSNLDVAIDESVREGVIVYRFKPGLNKIYNNMGYMAALSYDFADHIENLITKVGRPDIIETQEYGGIAYFLLHRKKQLNSLLIDIPISLNLHTPKFIIDEIGQGPQFKFPDFWIGELEKFSILSADVVISPSQYLVEQISDRMKVNLSNVHVIPNPYSVDSVEIFDNYVSDDMVFFGRAHYPKGLDQLISFLKEFWDTGLKSKLRVIGSDGFFSVKNSSFTDYLKKKYKKYVDNGFIKFEGLVPQKEAFEIISEAKVVFVPSLFESFSYAVVEAMARGKLVMASDSGGQREIIDNQVNGFLFDIHDFNSFEKNFSKILELTDSEIISMGLEARDKISKFCSYELVYEKKINLWENVIRSNPKQNNRKYPFIHEFDLKKNTSDENLIRDEIDDLLSVVIPYYNMGPWIQETLDSLMEVSYNDLEIIIVNDGSNDEYSIEVLNEIEKLYPVKLIHKKNGGLANARNEGVKHARGKYLAFLDADDKVATEYYTKAINILKAYDNVSFVGCWTQYFDGSNGMWITWNPEPPYFLVHNSVNSSALVYKKRDFILHGQNDPKMVYGMEDYESAISMVEANCRGVVITEPLFIYRIRPDSMSRQFNVDNQTYLYRLITDKHREFYSMFSFEIFNILNSNGPAYSFDNPSF